MFGRVFANFSEPNTLMGRGKLGLCEKLLKLVGGLSQADKINNSIKPMTRDLTPINSAPAAVLIS